MTAASHIAHSSEVHARAGHAAGTAATRRDGGVSPNSASVAHALLGLQITGYKPHSHPAHAPYAHAGLRWLGGCEVVGGQLRLSMLHHPTANLCT